MSEDALLAQDEGELSSFGYKQELRRTLKVFVNAEAKAQ